MSERVVRVRVAQRALRRSRRSHPWIYTDDILDPGDAVTGDVVAVLDSRGHAIGWGSYSGRSRIGLRMLRRGPDPPDDPWWSRVCAAALAHRRSLVLDDTDAYRVLFGESDGIPGLVADLYGRHLIVQLTTGAAERFVDRVLSSLREHGLAFDSVLARNDVAVRALEGLPCSVEQIEGTTPSEIVVREHGIEYVVDPWKGQKTGAFLDQRENRYAAGRLVRGRVLDAFAYHGSFALHAAPHCDEVVVLDSSAVALERARANAVRNGRTNLAFLEANAFDALRAMDRAGERFDVVLLDPPAFARSRRDLAAARRGYREINLRAMRVLTDDGILMTSSCSYNLGEAEFTEVVATASGGAGRVFRLEQRRGQAADHPIRLGFPESHYLKCLVLRSQTN